jgi:hypothetical protein
MNPIVNVSGLVSVRGITEAGTADVNRRDLKVHSGDRSSVTSRKVSGNRARRRKYACHCFSEPDIDTPT